MNSDKAKKIDIAKTVLKIIGLLIAAAGIAWFLLPLKRSTLNVGNLFGIFVCLLLAFLIIFYGKIARSGKAGRIIMRTLGVLFTAGIIWSAYLTVLMNSYATVEIPENTDIIVLGSQIYSEDRLSLSLLSRVEKASEYAKENPDTLIFVTGGQGSNEPATEASAQKKWLVENGVEESRIIVEDKSSDTKENLENTMGIYRTMNIVSQASPEFGIVTQGFHMFRAMKLAEEAGITPYPLEAETDFYIYPAYYGRELLSLTMWHFEQIFG